MSGVALQSARAHSQTADAGSPTRVLPGGCITSFETHRVLPLLSSTSATKLAVKRGKGHRFPVRANSHKKQLSPPSPPKDLTYFQPPPPTPTTPPPIMTTTKTTPITLPASQQQHQSPRRPHPWYHPLTIDLLADIANRSILHPFIACLIPLCLSAIGTPATWLRFQVACAYAIAITLWALLVQHHGRRVAFGAPRTVSLDDEVVVVTGGARGLGALVAEVYGMRGASVAVLDVAGEDEVDAERLLEEKNVAYYRCDVGDRAEVERVYKRIENDVRRSAIDGLLLLFHLFFFFSPSVREKGRKICYLCI